MAGGPQGGAAATQGGAAPSAARQGNAPSGSAPSGIAPVQQGEFPMRNRSRMGLVFVAANGTYEPRIVRLGVSNFDYTEVISGVKEGEEVALLAAAALQARREEQNQRFRGMTGGGVPGMSRPPAGQGGPAAGGAGGGAPRAPGGPGGAPRP
jgi:HlyD family secretion protein